MKSGDVELRGQHSQLSRGRAEGQSRGEQQWSWCVLIALLLRWCVAVQPHSGEARPPRYGDYEAQRHWQEVTLAIGTRDWYRNTSRNDLDYWGLDYPPLSAYHSAAMAHLADAIDPDWVAELTSRGREDPPHKLFMRASVILAELYTYAPAFLVYHRRTPLGAAAALFYPGLLLVDHAHFQYNCISLGLLVAAVAALRSDRFSLSALFFSLALNYKQTELYHALPFFLYLLRSGLRRPRRLVAVSLSTAATFLIIWLPFLSSLDDALSVLKRLFPLARGLFEDKVANFWCTTDPVFKWRNLLEPQSAARLSLLATIAAVAPSSVNIFTRPEKNKFALALINSSLAFFLFSYQVHEKSILACAVAVLLHFPSDPAACFRFAVVSSFSMLPLFTRNGSALCFWSLMVFYASGFYAVMSARGYSLADAFRARKINEALGGVDLTSKLGQLFYNGFDILTAFGTFVMLALSFCLTFVSPPGRFPDLFPVLISSYCCMMFLLYFIYFNYCQLFVPSRYFVNVKNDK